MINKEIAIKNIADIQKVIPISFAVYGTALGLIREGDIIGHDLDTDLGVFEKDFKWGFITELVQEKGFIIGNVFGMRTYGMEISLSRDGVKTDIMLFYEKPDGTIWNSLWQNGCRNQMADEIKHVYSKEMFELETVTAYGHTLKTVGLKYIKHVYGEDWRIPVTKWDWRTDHKCIQK